MINNRLKNIEQLRPKPIKLLNTQLLSLIEKQLWLKVIIAMVAGLMLGIVVGPSIEWVQPDTSILIGNWLALPGQLFLASIQMIVIPLVFASIILGLASSENASQLKKLGIIVSLYFVLTTAIASCIGIGVTLLLSPGTTLAASGTSLVTNSSDAKQVNSIEASTPPTLDELPQVLIQLLPGNPLTSMVEGQMLQIVIFALIFGIALVSMPPTQSKPLIELLGSLQQVCMTIGRCG